MAVSKNIESLAGISIRQFIQILKPVRSCIISINGREYIADEEISPKIHDLLGKFKAGH